MRYGFTSGDMCGATSATTTKGALLQTPKKMAIPPAPPAPAPPPHAHGGALSGGFLGEESTSDGGQRAERVAWSLNDFRIVSELGRGRHSKVLRAIHNSTGYECALKCYYRSTLDAHTLQLVKQEVAIHGSLSHPDISKMYAWFEDERGDIFLMLELFRRGDVFEAMMCNGTWSDSTSSSGTASDDDDGRASGTPCESHVVRAVIRPVVSAVAHLHANGRAVLLVPSHRCLPELDSG
jgi:serine/threonine protein kinase